MKTFVAAVTIALASVASAQLDNIPSCALNCFLEPLQSDGCSSLTDFACHCKKFDTLISSVTPCVQGACSADDQQTTIDAVEQTCADAGVSVSVSEPAGSSTAAPSSAAASGSAPASSAAASTTVAATTTEVVTSSVSGAPTASSNGTVISSAAPSSTASDFTGAAAQATQAAGILGAAALALLAL